MSVCAESNNGKSNGQTAGQAASSGKMEDPS